MTPGLLYLVTLLAAAGSGLMAGLFFVFSNFAMKAFSRLSPNSGCAAMQAINLSIINPLFLGVFLGTALCSVLAVVQAILHWSVPGVAWILAGGLIYLVGCMVVTIRCNVPLNDKLAAIDPEDPASSVVWEDYLARWVPWNHVRTIATIAAMCAFMIGLSQVCVSS